MELSAPNNADQHVVREAVCSGNLDLVRSRLDENPVLLWIKEPGTNQTLLHLAINNVQYDVARLLLLKGAFSEVPDGEGWKPLACAAMGGSSLFAFAEMLLEFGADVDSMNLQLRRSTLHICAETGFTRLAEMLLERDPQVDLEDVAGQTPLEKAVAWRRTDMVQLLLRHGATRRRNPGQGGAVHRVPMNRTYSPEDEDIKRLLKSSHLLQGPPVSRRSTWDTRPQQTIVARHPTPLDDWAKMTACHAFTATVVDFFIKEKERRIEESVTVYDLLYGRGGDRIMREAQAGQTEAKRSFRWYHLPANNVSRT
jgi:ankyrin repeat protein